MPHENAAPANPQPRRVLVVTGVGGIQYEGKLYSRGCEIPASILSTKGGAAMREAKRIGWRAPQDGRPQPQDLAAPGPAQKGNPPVAIVPHLDIVQSWLSTLARMIALCDDNAARALDLCLADEKACSLYQRATRLSAERHCRLNGLTGRRIVDGPMITHAMMIEAEKAKAAPIAAGAHL